MDERLQKALEFSNYTLTLNNQKRNIKNRVQQLQLVHHSSGVFVANQETIAFVKAMVDMEHTHGVLIDSKENPVRINNYKELLEKLVDQYISATQEYDVEYEKLRKSRNIKSIMDW
jgi:hypothetical protein